ncbi:MAG: helix-turn-helix domain-containing protein [Gammaproteobacteria bacterium]|nr:helix-turn-helix domain-containing protein [Gammaproteobacteria bacterium]
MSLHSTAIQNPTKTDIGVAKKSSLTLGSLSSHKISPAYLNIEDKTVELPRSAVKLLLEILNQIAEGNALTLIPEHANLSTQEAADLLNVSRPFVVKLLESGEIPYQKVGNRRRVLADQVLKYKERTHHARVKILQELVDQAQDLDMGYE